MIDVSKRLADLIKAVVAMIIIGILEVIAITHGIDGIVFSGVIAVIALIAGYVVRGFIQESREYG